MRFIHEAYRFYEMKMRKYTKKGRSLLNLPSETKDYTSKEYGFFKIIYYLKNVHIPTKWKSFDEPIVEIKKELWENIVKNVKKKDFIKLIDRNIEKYGKKGDLYLLKEKIYFKNFWNEKVTLNVEWKIFYEKDSDKRYIVALRSFMKEKENE